MERKRCSQTIKQQQLFFTDYPVFVKFVEGLRPLQFGHG